MDELEQLQRDVEQTESALRQKRARLHALERERESIADRVKGKDLAAFEALTASEQRRLYVEDPDLWRGFMDRKRDAGERALSARGWQP